MTEVVSEEHLSALPLPQRHSNSKADVHDRALQVGVVEEPTNVSELGLENPQIASLVARLDLVLSDVMLYRRLVGCSMSDAQQLLDSFQHILDIEPTAGTNLSLSFRTSLIVAMQRISARSGLYPSCYELKDVVLLSKQPQNAGGFSDIYKGDYQGQVVCLKTFRFTKQTEIDAAKVRFLERLLRFLLTFLANIQRSAFVGTTAAPKFAPIQGIFHSDDRVFMVSPWMANGDVRMYLSSNPDVPRGPLAMDVGRGLQYLHENSIIHGDLKGPNILIDSAGRAYITDLGISSVSGSHIIGWNYHKPVTSKGGSVRWQAPELFSPDNVSNSMESDVYAWGCVCFEILTGLVPFSHMQNDFAVMMHVSSGGRPARPGHLNSIFGVTDEMWPLMEQCWDADPGKRPSSRDIVCRLSLILNLQQDNRPRFTDDALSLRLPQKCHDIDILDVESLDRILQPTVSDEEICLEEDKWNANNVLILSGRKAFFDELDGIFGREVFESMIGDLEFHRRIKGDLIDNLEKRRGSGYEDEKERKMRADIEKAEARKKPLDELVRNLESKLETFTGSATGPKDEHMLKSWKEKCIQETNELKQESYGVELLHVIGFVYVLKAKEHLAARHTPFGFGGLLYNVQGKYHVLSDDVSMRLAAGAWGSVEFDLKYADKEGLSAEEKSKLEANNSEKFMQLWIKIVKCDIQSILRETCDRVLGDKSISQREAHLRAIALKILGEAFVDVHDEGVAVKKAFSFL